MPLLFISLVVSLAVIPAARAADIIVDAGNSAVVVDGSCSLAEAITNANDDASTHADCDAGSGADTITLTVPVIVDGAVLFPTPSVTGFTDFGPSGLPDITSEVTISGQSLTRTGSADYRFLVVRPTGSLTIVDSVIRDGRVVGSCEIFGNAADRSGCGGALVVQNGSLTLLNAYLTDNYAIESQGQDLPQGGAVAVLGGTLTAESSAFARNQAEIGGAVVGYFATMTFTDSSFVDNVAVASGGAIHNGSLGQLTIVGSTLQGNQVISAPSPFLGGGAVNNAGSQSTLVTVNSRFVSNSSQYGGAILNFNASDATLINTTLSGNSAALQGGAILNRGSGATLKLFASTVTNNTVDFGDGGGISNGGFSDRGIAFVRNSLIAANTASRGGGGISTKGLLTIEASVVDRNEAGFSGGGVFVGSATGQTVDIADSAFRNNVAGSDGGGLYYTQNPSSSATNTLSVDSTTFDGNEGDNGGGLFVDFTDVTVTGSTFSNNRATNIGSGGGGGINMRSFIVGGARLSMVNSTVSGNFANQGGGGLLLAGSTLAAELKSLTIADNNAASTSAAGGIQNLALKADVIVKDSALDANTPTNCFDFTGFGVTDGNGNFSSDDTCGFSGDNVNLQLDLLADNGGNTQTHALLQGSPAIDAASLDCPETDQRGALRTHLCDAGAFEAPPGSARVLLSSDTTVVYELGETSAAVSVTLDNSGVDAKDVQVRIPLRVTGNASGLGYDYTLSIQEELGEADQGRIADLVFNVAAGDVEQQTFVLTAVDDNLFENDELVEIAAEIVGNAKFEGDDKIVLTIVSDNAPPSLAVTIDIKPDGYPNSINLGSKGTLPVAILSSQGFDATTVDPLTITLAGAGVRIKPNSRPQVGIEDVNGDGLSDLVVHIVTSDLLLTPADEIGVLEAVTYDGLPVFGSDSVRLTPPR